MKTFLKAATVGMIAGMRSMSAPSTVSDYIAKKSPGAYDRFSFEWMVSPKATLLWRALAVGEMGGDKASWAPARIAPAPLAARAVSGGVSGASSCAADGESPVVGAVIGVAAAVASTFAFYHLRRLASSKLKAPDRVVGAVEDAAVLGLRKMVLG